MVDATSFATSTQARYLLAYFVLFAVLMAFGVWAALVEGPAMLAAAQERFDHEIAAENVGFCEKFGMRAGTGEFLACATELAIIRKKQVSRDRADELGIL